MGKEEHVCIIMIINTNFLKGVGVFQQILARQEPIEVLREIIAILRHSNSPQVDFIIRVMRKWASSQESKKGI